ncbi:MAG TPA: DUF6458 family protein [Streptosporangiaceae bacterium]|nr:DUF6458 family protein [Streptosporangiaceae bacterium]
MGVGVSVFLLILGAIFRFAIEEDLIGKSVDLHVIGVILMIAGGATFLLQILMVNRGAGGQRPQNERLYNGDNNPPNV